MVLLNTSFLIVLNEEAIVKMGEWVFKPLKNLIVENKKRQMGQNFV
jgi:hypothetical protein